jgi:hypothetical protein
MENKTCKTCRDNDDDLCDRKGILIEDDDTCDHHRKNWKDAMLKQFFRNDERSGIR